jgi:POT family proton-dependent oligopeptide transporter
MAIGHFLMAVENLFFAALMFLILGNGAFKPNISTQVGSLYPPGDPRRDRAFTIFYMGINLGAFIAPLICGYLGQQVNWHYGFAAAGVGMVIGLIQYVMGAKYLGDAGVRPAGAGSAQEFARLKQRAIFLGVLILAALVAFGFLSYTGALAITPTQIADAAGYMLLVVTVVFFAWLFFAGDWTPQERKRLYVIGIFFLAAALFWSLFEQAGSTLNLFADRDTRTVFLGFNYPSSWFQSVNSLFVWTLAPVFAWIWIALGPRQPSTVIKFSLGLLLVGAGFGVLILGARLAEGGQQVSPMWLIVVYLLHTAGELCLSPVGLSAMTKLAPARIAGLMMGVWFLATAVGNFIAGRVAGFYEAMPLPDLFTSVALFGIVAGGILLGLSPMVRRLMGGVR